MTTLIDFCPAEFPKVAGIEVRSFGVPGLPDAARPKRALRLVYRARPREQRLPIRGDFGFKVGGPVFVVDGECDEMLVPGVTRIEFNPGGEFVQGRIERITADRVAYVAGGPPWSRGYTYVPGAGAERRVSEEFFLCEVMVLDPGEWDIEFRRAQAAHDRFMGPDNPYNTLTDPVKEAILEKRADISPESTPQDDPLRPVTQTQRPPLIDKEARAAAGAGPGPLPTAAELNELEDSPQKRLADRAADRLK